MQKYDLTLENSPEAAVKIILYLSTKNIKACFIVFKLPFTKQN